MYQNYLVLFVIIGLAMFLTVRMRKLTATAAFAGGIIGALVYLGAGFTGVAMMACFFILGTAASSHKKNAKTLLGIAEENEGRRTVSQVLANAGVAALLGAYVYVAPGSASMLQVMMAASFAAATADTLSSELGNVYGRRFYNIISFRKDQRGLNGVISFEGTMAGLAGSVVIAAVSSIGFGFNLSFLWIVIGGTVGNLADSILGATVERKRYFNNDAVNFFNTATGALTAMVLTDLL